MNMLKTISVGLAMFAMLFGAGNVVWPLALGRDSGSMLFFGLAGFIITAVIIPFAGLISTMLCDGQYSKFLGRLGKIPGFFVTLVCMSLIGPFVLSPRCVTISHAAVKLYMPQFSLFYFSILSAALIYMLTRKQTSVVEIVGKYLAPVQLMLLLSLIIVGFIFPSNFLPTTLSAGQSFGNGLLTGYKTADLLGCIFFSGLIFTSIRQYMKEQGTLTAKKLAVSGLSAGLIGASLLAILYVGFCIVAGYHGAQLKTVPDGDIFCILSSIVLGNVGGFITNLSVAMACLTTVVALVTVFAQYLQKNVFFGKMNYQFCLISTIVIMTVMANLGFDTIMRLAMPFLTALYPGLIVLTFTNAANILFGFKWVKAPVFITFAITLILQYWNVIKTFWAPGIT